VSRLSHCHHKVRRHVRRTVGTNYCIYGPFHGNCGDDSVSRGPLDDGFFRPFKKTHLLNSLEQGDLALSKSPRNGHLALMATLMTRGLGRLQQAIVYLVKENGPTTIESMRWYVRDADEDADLGVGTINAVNRAVESLVARKLLKHSERPLQSVEECVAHYSGKTLKAAIRKLRTELLPALLEPSKSRMRCPRYSLADNEKFHHEGLTEVEREVHRNNWLSVERELAAFLGAADDFEQRSRLFGLYAKSKSIFEAGRLEVTGSLREHLTRCRPILPAELLERVERVYTSLLSAERAGNLQMRTFVHTFVNVSNKGSCRLKGVTIEHLSHVRRDYLESLPNYKRGTPVRPIMCSQEDRHDPILHKLFDQTVFQSFNFIEAA